MINFNFKKVVWNIDDREKLFLGNILKCLDLEIFGPSHSWYVPLHEGKAPASELELQRGGLPSEIAFSLSGGNLRVQNHISKGSWKSKKYFRLI